MNNEQLPIAVHYFFNIEFMIKIIEAPRDAMQGVKEFIPTDLKISYINSLLKVGFDTIDFGSFVSPKAIPQLRDTAEVLAGLQISDTNTKLLAIVGNARGANDAVNFEEIDYIGFPFSISETFLKRNINSSIEKSTKQLDEIINICDKNNKIPVIYISMAFGNPYGDKWNNEITAKYSEQLYKQGVKIIALSDTVGSAKKEDISLIFNEMTQKYDNVEFGLHLHTNGKHLSENLEAAYSNGCRRFDTAIRGLGGCPMADDDLTGNLPTEKLLEFLENKGVKTGINGESFTLAQNKVFSTFPQSCF